MTDKEELKESLHFMKQIMVSHIDINDPTDPTSRLLKFLDHNLDQVK